MKDITIRNAIADNYLDNLSIEQKTQSWRTQLENPREKVHFFVANE